MCRKGGRQGTGAEAWVAGVIQLRSQCTTVRSGLGSQCITLQLCPACTLMTDHLTPHFNLKSMASIDTCQSGATCNVSSQAGTLTSQTGEPNRALAARGREEEKGSEPGNHSARCFISGSCDRKCKAFGSGLRQRWIAAGEAQSKCNSLELLVWIQNV